MHPTRAVPVDPPPAPTAERPVRVCLVAPSLDILGGQAVNAQRLLDRLRLEPTLEVDLLPVNPRLPGPLRLLQRIKYVRTLVTEAWYLTSLAVRLHRYDVIHVFSASYFSFVLAPTPALLAARLLGRPTILNYRSGQARDHLARWRRTALPTVRLATEVVVPSGYLVGVFGEFDVPASYVHNAVDVDATPFRARGPVSPRFLANRNLEPLYNVECALRAFALVQARFPEASLVVAGDGSQRGGLEALAGDLGLRNVRFLGQVTPEAMGELYEEAEIYLNASSIDNMPNSIVEAYAAGVPVVSTDAGGIPFIVTHDETGLLAPVDDHQALATQALRILMEPDLASRLSKAGRARAEEHYSWGAVTHRWVELYRRLRAQGRSAKGSG